MGVITYNGLLSSDYGIHVETPPNYQIPNLDVEFIHVPGRNGDVITTNSANSQRSYQNTVREYDISFGKWKGDFQTQADAFVNWYLSSNTYARLEDTYDPTHYRMAVPVDGIDVENILSQAGRSTISFNCMPQRWLKDGEAELNLPSTLETVTNPTNFTAEPLFYFEENPNSSVTKHGIVVYNTTPYHAYSFYLLKGFGRLYLDCSSKDAYYDGKNMNHYIEYEDAHTWPKLTAGVNRIAHANDLAVVRMVPRWWTI